MIKVDYSTDGIRVDIMECSKYNQNQPYKLNILKHVSGDEQWSTNLNDFWFATFPNTEMYDTQICDSKGNILYTKKWDVMEHGNYFYKSLWLYNKKIMSDGRLPKGLVIGTHDGEFGEWVPIALKREAKIVLVEASDKQFKKLSQNYGSNSMVTFVNELVTPDGGEVEFFEGGEGYTNSVVESVIKHWEKDEIHTTTRSSISITDLILNELDGDIDWLHLDVEGLDAKLIMGVDESKVKLPNYIIFEDYNLSNNEKKDIYNYLHMRGYQNKSEGGICESIKLN